MKRIVVLVAAALLALPAKGHAQLDSARASFSAHRYRDAERIVERMLARNPANAEARIEKAKLLIQAWQLDAADSMALRIGHADVRAVLLRGRIQLLKKEFATALATARRAQRLAPTNAEAFLLEAEVHFWGQRPDLAAAPLLRAIALDSLNADARFAYGYAIWRRIDAQQLPAMAAEWNRALEIDPLHYATHWHFGNGHTHLTYADYAQPSDRIVRVRLRGVDSLVAQERIAEALDATRALEREFPEALLPALARGSIFYMAYGLPRAERLDSAQAIVLELLKRKKNYGPAHNGLAAVIKQRQAEFVANYDSLENEIAATPLPADSAFTRVFKDLAYYPGTRVERMARQQLGPSLAYLPMLARLGYTYTVPPLHRDLDDALGRNFFRTSTTFDNRQWMDIRGAGGNHAAAGIEYVERGSHQERVVLLHEYVHQWHGAVLTDQENRRIRQLYHDAIANGRTLDYYAANNESEFFAQSYEAYLAPVKVHPLNHKAMNTRSDLIAKDPELFAFLDTMITRNRAALAGDANAMRSNWAHVFVTLARQARGRGTNMDSVTAARALAFADTALRYDDRYIPAMIEAAQVAIARRQWDDAERWLGRAELVDPRYAPLLTARADYVTARAHADGENPPVEMVIDLNRRALTLETDLAERARLNTTLRELYRDQALYPEAIALAESQIAALAPSTYLRDQKDEAAVFIAGLRTRLGDARAQLPFFRELVARKPQHFRFRAQAAATLIDAGLAEEALRVVAEGERILRAGGQPRADFTVLRASALTALGRTDDADSAMALLTEAQRMALADADRMRIISTDIVRGNLDAAEAAIPAEPSITSPLTRADYLALRGRIAEARDRDAAAAALYREALASNPYQVEARIGLVNLFGRKGEAANLIEEAERLPVKLGADWYRVVR